MAGEMVALSVALVVAGVGTGLLVPLLRRVQLLDVPNHRSSHVDVTPRGGGIALLLAVVVAVAVTGLASPREESPVVLVTVLGAAVALALVGLVDDARSLPSRYRLAAQVAAAVAVAAVLAVAEPAAGLVLAVVSVLGYVSYVNAFNFMDGVNGISALSAAVAGAWYWWLTGTALADTALDSTGVVGASLVGASLGFLVWNLRGRIFLGDVGSYGVGAVVAGLAVSAWTAGVPAVLAIAPLLVYLADTGSALVLRAARGQRLGEPHRGHAYQRLVDGGWSHLASSAWCAGSSALVCLLVALGQRQPALLVLAALVVAAYVASPVLVGRRHSVGARS